MSRVLLIGDVHLRDSPPVNCTPEFLDDLWHSLEFVAAASYSYDATVFAGDLFDFKQPSKTSHALMLRAIEVFGRMHNPWCIAGNHDLSADRIESLQAKQPLGVLIAAGAIALLDGWHPDLPVYGIPWQQDWAKSLPWVLADFREYRDPNSLIVTHAPLFPPGSEPPYEFLDLNEFAKAMGRRGNVFYGHIHDRHGVYTRVSDSAGDVKFANHGSLNRARLTKSDIERTVTVTAWDSTTGAFTPIPVPDQLPASKIFRLDQATAAKAEQRTLDEFLQAVGRSTLDISSTSAITEHIKQMDAPENVKSTAISLIEEQES